MSLVRIDVSPKQLSKLKRGHPVRVKGGAEGRGFNLLIHPDKYEPMSRAFSNGAGVQIALSPQEIVLNQQGAEHLEGTGIFGKTGDKVMDKLGVKKLAYHIGDKIKPGVKAAILGGLTAGGAALAGTAAFGSGGVLAPLAATIPIGVLATAHLANSYLDNPSAFQGSPSATATNIGGPKAPSASTLAGQVAQNHIYNQLNQELGTHYGALGQANLANAVAHTDRAIATTNQIAQRGGVATPIAKIVNEATKSMPDEIKKPAVASSRFGAKKVAGTGLFAGGAVGGTGLYAGAVRGRGIGGRIIGREIGSVGLGGSFVSHSTQVPPAMISQPFSSNFQFQHTLPPAYARFSKGSGLYA